MADPKANTKGPVVDSEAQEAECEALEEALTRLRVAYEQYFLGADRHPPTSIHANFRQRMERLKSAFVRNTVVRFRVGNLAQKAKTYEQLWSRTLVEIENGTYRRDLFKVRRKQQLRASSEVPEDDAEEKAPKLPALPAVARPPPPPGALSDEKIRDIYNSYVEAKRKCNEDTSKVSLEGLAVALRKQVPDLLKRHKAQSVEFKVVIKDGKAVLRAVPK